MIDIITKKEEWRSLIKSVQHYDFYHTWYYHELSKKEDETPILIKYTEDDLIIALPLLIRPINGTPYKDATSVYGYPGPLFLTDPGHFDNSKLRDELHDYFVQSKIVTVFSRLHPYIEYQESILIGMGEVVRHNDVVNIDLELPLEVQRQRYNSRLKTYINKARKFCSVYRGKENHDIQAFIDIYYRNMQRVNANVSYFFSKEYFHNLLLSEDFEAELLLCKLNDTGEIIGGAIFVKTDNIIQYHLSGSKEEYLHLSPVKLIIDEMRIEATEQKYTYFNLGGGKANREDSLFNFKTSFSHNLKSFKIWKYITDKKTYEYLIERELKRVSKVMTDEELAYFPAYRLLPQISQLIDEENQ